MRKCAFLWVVLVILAFQAGMLTSAQADVVGRLTQVEGRVDILRGGKLPAIPVKLNDGVQTGDVLRTKSLSKAQITFIDNSTMTISPESRVGIEAYMFDSSKNKRNAVVQLFQGLAHVAVSKIFKAAEPDFVVKTQTAIMGVRGTDFGVRIYPNSSDVLNFEGLLQVGNRLPEVSQLFRRAFKVAYSFGSGGAAGQHWVFLKAMQGTSVGLGLPPSAVFAVTPAMKSSFMDLFSTLGSRGPGGGGATGGGGVTAGVGASGGAGGIPGGGGAVPSSGFLGLNQPGTGAIIPLDPTIAGTPVGVVTPPVVVPTTVAPPPPPPPPPPPAPSPLPPHPPR
ncbi:MAG: FecR family protein [Desulfobacterales bacterium]|nr:FecR family protein [Pseudomonadota bacterium]MBU4354147.1 FecR family protein [Pseudomonadota bacterium]MCG2772130.1 FecR family protein [Desulfobacterales bacterium]